MASSQDFRPNWASAPGDTINDILQDRGISKHEFAQIIDYTLDDVENLLCGRTAITIGLARKLQDSLGGSVTFWMNRDFQYRQDINRLNEKEKNWLNEIPVGDMIKFGWIKPIPHPSEELSACLRFFNVPNVDVWRETYSSIKQITAFRTSPSLDSRAGSIVAWLRQGEIEAEKINCQQWNPNSFKESLSSIRTLTRQKDPNLFIPRLQKYCAESGVAVVIVRVPSGCRASGAARIVSGRRAILQLSFRYLTDDHFWFTFFHEAGHLILHADKGLFIESLDSSSQKNDIPTKVTVNQKNTPTDLQLSLENLSTNEEEEANEFAEKMLIPVNLPPNLSKNPIDHRDIIRFATHIGISPGIVVGQLQKRGTIGYNQLNSLKRRFYWEGSDIIGK